MRSEPRPTRSTWCRMIVLMGSLVASSSISACGARTGLDVPPPATIPGLDNAYTCSCTCTAGDTGETVTQSLEVCVPPELNPNLGGDLTTAAIEHDCEERVVNVAHASAVTMMGTGGIDCEFFCDCAVVGAPFPGSPACDMTCPSVPLVADGDVKAATVHPTEWPCFITGDDHRPVCRVPGSDPPTFTPEGAFATFMTPASRGTVTSGEAVITIGGSSHTTPVTGRVSFPGRTCMDEACDAGMTFALVAAPVEVGNVLGLADVVLDRVVAGGAGTPGALVLDATGRGSYALGTVQAWGRGDAVERVLGIETSRTTGAFTMLNTDVIAVHLDRAGRSFTIADDFAVPAGDDPSRDPAVSIRVSLAGHLDNQPPRARITAPGSVECTSSAGAEIALSAESSTDPDDNIAMYAWRVGDRLSSAAVGHGPVLNVVQSARTEQTYSLLVLDDAFQRSDATATVSVVDSSAPQIDGVVVEPDCLWPPNHRFVRYALGDALAVTASDVCDAAPTVRIVSVVSDQATNGHGDGSTDPDVLFGETGFCIRAERSGNIDAGRTYTITVEARDSSGNATTRDVTVHVPHSVDGCAHVTTGVLDDHDAASACVFAAVPLPEVATTPPVVVADHDGHARPRSSAGGCSISRTGTSPFGLVVLVALVGMLARRRSAR